MDKYTLRKHSEHWKINDLFQKNMNVGVQYAPPITIACCALYKYCRVKNEPRVVKEEELVDATLKQHQFE